MVEWGCCVLPEKKKGGGGRPVSAQYEVRLKRATTQLRQILRSCAWWLCRFTQKKWSNKKSRAVCTWTDDHLLKLICGLSTSAVSESTNARGKNRSNHVGDRHGMGSSQSGKKGVARLNTAQFSLFCVSTNRLPELPGSLKKKREEKRPQVAHPHSRAEDFPWLSLPHAGSAIAILRLTSHCAETARFLPHFFGGTEHPIMVATGSHRFKSVVLRGVSCCTQTCNLHATHAKTQSSSQILFYGGAKLFFWGGGEGCEGEGF